MIDISVCIPTFNRKEYLRRAIDSVLYQLGPNDEIVVGDNASPDGTQNLMAGFVDQRIKYYRNENNIGPILNFDKVIKATTKDFIVFLTDDDYFLTNAIVNIKNFFEATDVSIFKTAFFTFDETRREGRFFSYFESNVETSNVSPEKAALIYHSGHIATGLCFRKILYDNNPFLTNSACWYPTMLLLGMGSMKMGYLATPTNIHTGGNETFWGVSPADRKRLNDSQQMNINYLFENGYIEYDLAAQIIFEHFRRFDNQDNQDIYNLLDRKDQEVVRRIVSSKKNDKRLLRLKEFVKKIFP